MASVDIVIASFPSLSPLPFTNIFYEDRKKFDVFLSFRGIRGIDTCTDFTDHLYVAINQKGISTYRDEESLVRGKFIAVELLRAIEESKIAVVVLSRNYAFSTWCLTEVAKIVECMEEKKLVVLPIFHCVDPNDVRNQRGAFAEAFAEHEERFRDSTEVVSLWRDALTKVANIPGWVLNYGDPESQLIHDFIESLSNRMLEDGSTNDVTPDDADEMVQDYVADLPLIGLEFVSLSNLSNQMLEDGSVNWNLPPRFDATPDESDESDDADEMLRDYAADLPLEAHVVPDDVADVPQEAHVANLPQLCPICDNAIGVAFCCGHMFCVECGDACDNCPVCRDRVHIRFRVFLPQ